MPKACDGAFNLVLLVLALITSRSCIPEKPEVFKDVVDIFPAVVYGVTVLLFAALLYIALMLFGMPKESLKFRDNLTRTGMINHAGEAPILISKKKDKSNPRIKVLIFYALGFPLSYWQDHKEIIETGMNIVIDRIEQGNNRNTFVVYATDGNYQLPDRIDWNTTLINSTDSVLILGESIARTVEVDLAKIPHLLLGGSTGSGKTILLKLDEQLELNEISESTYDRKLETLKMLSEISEMEIKDITEKVIKDFFKKKLHYAQSCIDKIYQLLNWVLKRAVKQNVISENPLTDFKIPKSKQKRVKVRGLTIDEQSKLLEVLKSGNIRYSEVMMISMFTGMRGGEVCALDVEDINFKRKTITVYKTVSRNKFKEAVINDNTKTEAGTRILHINDDMIAFFKKIIGDRTKGRLFSSAVGKILTTQQVNYQFWSLMKKGDILDNSVSGKVNLHSLRHTYASRCIEGGMPAKVLQKILGHRDITTTLNVYCDCFDKYEQEHLDVANEYMKKNNLAIA